MQDERYKETEGRGIGHRTTFNTKEKKIKKIKQNCDCCSDEFITISVGNHSCLCPICRDIYTDLKHDTGTKYTKEENYATMLEEKKEWDRIKETWRKELTIKEVFDAI